MKRYIAIVKVDDNRVAKYQDFDKPEQADNHVTAYGGLVYDNNSHAPLCDLWIENGEVSVVPVPEPTPPTDEDRIDAAFPQTDTAKVIFEAFFELANDVCGLKGQQPITRAQLRDWLKSKLP